MITTISITVPGGWDPAVTCLDLETAKVSACEFVMQNGEILRNRWQIILAGIASYGTIQIIHGGNEIQRLRAIGKILKESGEVRYAATRKFDEMVCKGKFTNARRAHEQQAFFPPVPGAEKLNWHNVYGEPIFPISRYERGQDIDSKDVPKAWTGGTCDILVLVHLLRDVAELILTADPDIQCEKWCRRALSFYDFVSAEIKKAS